MEIQVSAKQKTDDLMTTLETLQNLLDVGLQLEQIKDEIKYIADNESLKECMNDVNAAEENLMKCWSHVDAMIDPVQKQLDDILQKSNVDVPHKYRRIQIDRNFYKIEGKYSYLFEFPRQVTKGKKTNVWLPKKFCSKRKDAIEVRFYDDTTFRMFDPKHTDQACLINADEFCGLVADAKIHLTLTQGKNVSNVVEYVCDKSNRYR